VETRQGVENGALAAPTVITDWSSLVTGSSPWTKMALSIQATGGNITVFLEGNNPTTTQNQCNVFFDDASAFALPEPSSIVALLAGLRIVGMAIRRRKQAGLVTGMQEKLREPRSPFFVIPPAAPAAWTRTLW